jgi:hypothetical protein
VLDIGWDTCTSSYAAAASLSMVPGSCGSVLCAHGPQAHSNSSSAYHADALDDSSIGWTSRSECLRPFLRTPDLMRCVFAARCRSRVRLAL